MCHISRVTKSQVAEENYETKEKFTDIILKSLNKETLIILFA